MKKPRYQDYVIKDGVLVGEFEQMYRDYEEPWEQTQIGRASTAKLIGLDLLERTRKATGARKVIELGCGLGDYAHRIAAHGFEVLGLDVSETAIAKARGLYPDVRFECGTTKDLDAIFGFSPDVIVMSEITWYILDDLRNFLDVIRAGLPDVFILHLLATYPAGVQKFGTEYFTNLEGILAYFDMRYVEFGEIVKCGGPDRYDGPRQTFFLSSWNSDLVDAVARVR